MSLPSELEAPPEADALPADPGGSDPPASPARVPFATVASWGMPIFALSSTLFFLQFFFLKFATDVLLIAPVVVGVLFSAGRLWDAVSDPIVGTWSDRTRSRYGRRRPWMMAAIPLLAATIWMTWSPPRSLEGTPLVVWVGLSLFGYYTAFTIYNIPHFSLGAELSSDHHDRSRVFGVQSASFMMGMMLAFVGMQWVMTSTDQRTAASEVAAVAIGLVCVFLLIPPLRVRERPEYQGRGAQQPLRAMQDVVRNPHALRLLFVQLVQTVGVSVVGLLSPYLVQYVLRRPDLVAALPAAFVVFNLASIPAWVALSKRYGKKQAWTASMLLSGLVFAGTSFAGRDNVMLLLLLMPLAGFALGCGGTVGPSILADVIDGDELETGERKEGAYNAAWGFSFKLSNAVMILVTSVVLQAIGFTPNQEQSEGVQLALRLVFGGLPFVMLTCAAFVLHGFRLDAVEHARIRAALAERARAAG